MKDRRARKLAGLMSLDDVAEAVGLPRGRVTQILGEHLPRVKVWGRVFVPEGAVITFVKAERYLPMGGTGPSPAFRWMVGESHRISQGRNLLDQLLSAIKGLSPEGLSQVFQGFDDLRALMGEATKVVQADRAEAPP